MINDAFWIWSHNKRTIDKEVCYFRKTFQVSEIPQNCEIKVSADSKYRLYINGHSVARGPRKSDRFRRYYDTIDVAEYLVKGENIIASMVAHFGDDEVDSRIFETGPISIIAMSRGGFLLICDTLDISTNYTWLVLKDESIQFFSPYLTRYGTDMMKVKLCNYPTDFELLDYDERYFTKAVHIINTDLEKWASITQWPLTKAPIPPLAEIEKKALRVKRTNISNADLLLTTGTLEIPQGGPYYIELDMGELTTSYVEAQFDYCSDKDAEVHFTYAESYFKVDENGNLYKGIRDDSENSLFDGETDIAVLNWGKLKFETIFYRTFRLLRLDISYTRVPLTIKAIKFIETTYPLNVIAQCEYPEIEKEFWNISVNTLRLCMHDTYEDCPYYEQMQYTMDTALQMIYTYQLSVDDKLARSAIDAFSASRMPDGLVMCSFPSKFVQVIPGFALYYVDMLYNHYLYYKDERFIKKYICVSDSILAYFSDKLDEETGLFERSEYWEFVDWVKEWHHNYGAPLAKNENVNTIYHEMYIYFLKKAADLNDLIGRNGISDEYRQTAQRVKQGVLKYCYDEEQGLFTDTVGRKDASTHAQFWAVLSGIIEGEQARSMMLRVIEDKSLFQCSYSMTFYLFRALEMTGLYKYAIKYLDTWKGMMNLNMTTWCEDPVTQRSDCHGWSSLPIYEFAAMTLGIKPNKPGYEEILINPFTENHEKAKGTIATIKGTVTVCWEKEGDKIKLSAKTPIGVPVKVKLNNCEYNFVAGGDFSVIS